MTPLFDLDRLRQALVPLRRDLPPDLDHQGYRAHYRLADSRVRPEVTVALGALAAGGYQLAVQGWWPREPRGSLLLLHGYYDHMGLYGHVVDWALSRQWAVLACDLPGHGLSSGARASINDFGEYQTALTALIAEARRLDLPRPWHLLGQSTGGAILLDYLLRGEPAPELGETILLAPLVRPHAWRQGLWTYRLVKPFVRALPRRFSVNSGDPAFLDFLQQDGLQPRELPAQWVGALARWIPQLERAPASTRSLLVIQGEQDFTVDWRHNLGVLEAKFARPEVLRLPEARHHLVNETEALRQRYFRWLDERLA
ncbi:alpha/beta hydrolase [Pseudomonas oryzihabitans]|uniref:Alpha/beta hydrolase n=1 Tax=Pseudomonas oryzihabitans TaxID=47885 RepID=A0A2Z5AH13_9PSED|nr:alpha/beta hydrolase [Pseudomonas oryzihabitans]AXA68470.1 alpha/beta hydrolase [Pseudomonas oryzihabitans]